MFNNVSILIPYQPDNGPRDLIFKWIKEFYKTTMPDAELCIHVTNDQLFNKSKAINLAAKKATREIFVIADADMIYSPSIIADAIQLLEQHTWIIPFRNIRYLSNYATNKLLKTQPNWPPKIENEKSSYILSKYGPKAISGGINIISRTNFNVVGGFDERFAGWGGEDNAFCYAVNTLCGPLKRLDHDIYHLWHPKIGWQRSPNAKNNRLLLNLYKQANGNINEMKKLIKAFGRR